MSMSSTPDGPLSPASAPEIAGPFAGENRVVAAARRIRRGFRVGDQELEVLHGIDLELRQGEVLALVGKSGAGKSTLLHILGLLDRPSEGAVLIDGADAWQLPPSERSALRNRYIGFVFQFYHLLPELNALENVLLPAMISDSLWAFRRRRREYRARARQLLERFGLSARLKHRPSQLSGGERQRVALARALFHDPPVLIADEPTGNLDTATGEKVLNLIFEEQARRGLSLLLVTHDLRLAERCGRVLTMQDGMIQADSSLPVPD